MYLHLGQSVVVPFRDVIGIFDLDTTTDSRITREFLKRAEREGELVDVSMDLPKSLVLCRSGGWAPSPTSPSSPPPPSVAGWRAGSSFEHGACLRRARRPPGPRKNPAERINPLPTSVRSAFMRFANTPRRFYNV